MGTLENTWRKSSYSGTNGACIEVAGTGRLINIRDSTDRDGAVLVVTGEAWSGFVASLK
jgi:hypothetical protein